MHSTAVVRPQVPTSHLLRAALRAGQVLDAQGTKVETVRSSYSRVPTGGMYHSSDLQAGEDILVECRLVQLVGDSLLPSDELNQLLTIDEREACELLLFLVLEERRPLWSRIAVRGGEVAEEMIPDSDLSTLSATVSDPERREALLLALGQTYDPAHNVRVGEVGEEAVKLASKEELIGVGRPDLADQVQRVSLISDHLGYDVVAPTTAGGTRRMEVKTCGQSREQWRVHLSRNQVETGLRDPSWYLVVCTMCGNDDATVVGWCQGDYLRTLLPIDQSPRARWSSMELVLPSHALIPGLPPVHNKVTASAESQMDREVSE